ncbi:hypothetical protein [Marinobacterium lutimaris]|uniref:Uncharacterized protein n=1 Tax=Marinobacterium lutimaris TaxID=568106 RepID=A0A1H5Z859_9GAMM|nr:hypothetical protein [Marinobacterium lutimaris]SEG31915.1 hypothetical protein SAMN05444390_1012040 [Marinobacterium lutimaris]
MKFNATKLSLIIAVPLIVASLGAAVYFFWDSMQASQEANEEILHKFGFQIVPNSPYTETTGELGAKQVPATFAEDDLSPVEKVIRGLLFDKEQLIEENAQLQSQIDELHARIDKLEQYKTSNEQFAPENLAQEMIRTRAELRDKLRALPEAQRFTDFWINMMTDASMYEYRQFINANRLMLDEAHREQMVGKDLVDYGFCIGNAVELAANSVDEAQSVARWLKDPQSTKLANALREDLKVVIPPCRAPLRAKLDTYLAGNLGTP